MNRRRTHGGKGDTIRPPRKGAVTQLAELQEQILMENDPDKKEELIQQWIKIRDESIRSN